MLLLALLFVLLSPGILLTLPPIGKVFMSGKTSLLSAVVHSIVFVIVYSVLISYTEGYAGFLGATPTASPAEVAAGRAADAAYAATAAGAERARRIAAQQAYLASPEYKNRALTAKPAPVKPTTTWAAVMQQFGITPKLGAYNVNRR